MSDVRIPKIPKFIADQYGGGVHAFKAAKRREVRAAIKSLEILQSGAAYLPGGSARVTVTLDELHALLDECSVRKWGR